MKNTLIWQHHLYNDRFYLTKHGNEDKLIKHQNQTIKDFFMKILLSAIKISFIIAVLLLTGCDVFIKINESEWPNKGDKKNFGMGIFSIPNNCSRAVISPDGKNVYAINNSYEIQTYDRSYKNNQLENYRTIAAAASIVQDIYLTPDGKFLYFSESNVISFFKRDRNNGNISNMTNTDATGDKIIIPKDGKSLYTFCNNVLYCYIINLNTGGLTQTKQFTYSDTLLDYVFSPDSRFLYFSTDESPMNRVYIYKRYPETGIIEFVSDPTFMVNYRLMVSQDGNFFYILNDSGLTIYYYNRNNANGSIVQLSDTFFISNTNPNMINFMKMSPSGNYVIIGRQGTDSNYYVTSYYRNKNSVTLNDYMNFMVSPTALSPKDIVFSPDERQAFFARN
jgi:6-phosphogluconolactonase (cycloisomerase 2 family)